MLLMDNCYWVSQAGRHAYSAYESFVYALAMMIVRLAKEVFRKPGCPDVVRVRLKAPILLGYSERRYGGH